MQSRHVYWVLKVLTFLTPFCETFLLTNTGKDTDNYLKWCYLSKMGQEWKQDRLYRAYVEEYFATPDNIYPKTAKTTDIDANLEPHKNKLGNIFVFGNGDNSGLENSPYEQKREVYRTSRFVSANDVALTNEHWTITEFQNRHNNVCNKLSRLLLRFYE